jgi:hypothetical protein
VALLVSVLLAASPADPGGAIARVADDLAQRAALEVAPARIALAVLAPGVEALRDPVETALAGALGRRGHAVLPLRGAQLADPEAAARALGADALLRVRAALAGGTLALSGEIVPTRPNFFLQRAPQVRPAGSRVVVAAAPDDEASRALAAASRPGPRPLRMRAIAELPERVLALAAGPTGEGGAARIVAVTPTGLALLDARGGRLASRPLPPPSPGPRVRDAAAVAVVGDLGGAGRIGCAVAGGADAEILSAAGDRLERVSSLPSAGAPGATIPVAAGAAGVLYGAFVPGRGTLADVLSPRPDAAAHPRSGRELIAVSASPRTGRVAYGVLGADFALRLLGAGLEPVAPDVLDVGAGFTLADLDGDGEPEVVASSAVPGPADRVRVLRPRAAGSPLFEAEVADGPVVAAAAADLTGDGIDDAVLAAALPGGGTRLLLLTSDASGGVP